MITRAEAEHIAAGWAHRQSLYRGYRCTPNIDELALGYAVWMRLPAEARPEPGEDVTTVIDRETGRLSHWPPSTPAVLEQRYTELRDTAIGVHRTSDPIAELRREAHRRVSPTVSAHITLGGRLFRARGAKGDQELRHHPLIAGRLERIGPRMTVRGADRHAELLVASDVLYEAGKNRAPLTRDDARALFSEAVFETFHVRETGDWLGGRPSHLCATCWNVLAGLGVAVDPKQRPAFWVETRAADPQPGRFPVEVAKELAGGGWDPATRQAEAEKARELYGIVEQTAGREFRLERFPALEAADEFHGVSSYRNSPGAAHLVRPFTIGSLDGTLYMADVLHEFGELIGARMFPIGREGRAESVLAIDDRGRVFALDQGGEWFIGETLDEALVALTAGLPAARISDDGTW